MPSQIIYRFSTQRIAIVFMLDIFEASSSFIYVYVYTKLMRIRVSSSLTLSRSSISFNFKKAYLCKVLMLPSIFSLFFLEKSISTLLFYEEAKPRCLNKFYVIFLRVCIARKIRNEKSTGREKKRARQALLVTSIFEL